MNPLAKSPPAGEARRVLEKRFWSKVDKRGPDECWPWMAYCYSSGYGQFWIDYYSLNAHRAAWWLAHGTIPEDIWVLHTCDNRRCVNPAHLFLGTHADNMADRNSKGRQSTKLTEKDVRAIREEYANTPATQKELALKYGVTHAAISHIFRSRTWTHIK